MTGTTAKGVIPQSFSPLIDRNLSHLAADTAAVQALLQAAVNVENFTIPLYLSTMASIYGTHAISNPLAKGRLWPGMKTTAGSTLTTNQNAYNTIFSVFIQEMLHLQLAANLSASLGVTPKFFVGTVLQNTEGGWGCYSSTNTVIPHIIDLTDTTTFSSVVVNLNALTSSQINLFLAIEQSHDAALQNIKPAALDKYFPAVPFAGWTAANGEADLPMFGTIGWMYYCLLSYLSIEYTDGKSLWEKMFAAANLSQQRDVFNRVSQGHPQAEYPLMATKITVEDPLGAFLQALDIIAGICDQGEGNSITLIKSISQHLRIKLQITDNNVSPLFQPDKAAMIADYPDYDANGNPTGQSSDADARATGDKIDHWDRFNNLTEVIGAPNFMNFAQWFAAGNSWQAADLQTPDYVPNPKLPTPQDVAQALNQLNSAANQQLLNNLVVGAINGINQALTTQWGEASAKFPFQAMAASGDRMSLYWAVMGAAPDLSQALPAPTGDDKHACQGLSVSNPGNDCAAIAAYHTCGGSNACKGQGGCGYPNQGTDGNYIAPSDNSCAQKGGCGAPISAWQIYSTGGTMDIIDIDTGEPFSSTPQTISFASGDGVYDTAWKAYSAVMQDKQLNPGTEPTANPIRTVLPPN